MNNTRARIAVGTAQPSEEIREILWQVLGTFAHTDRAAPTRRRATRAFVALRHPRL